jgi:hypothetical protein
MHHDRVVAAGSLLELHRVPMVKGAVAVALHLPAGDERVACVVACHGLGASKGSDATGRYVVAPSGIDRHLVIQSEADETVAVEHGVTLHADHRITDPTHRHQAIEQSLA